MSSKALSRLAAGLVLCIVVAAAGCEKTEAPLFRMNFEGKDRAEYDRELQQQIVDITTAMFGQPDTPFVLPETELDAAKIALASGPVSSDGVVVTTKAGPVYAGAIVKSDEEQLLLRLHGGREQVVPRKEVTSEHPQRGLYRQHCMHCHGITGDGNGPTASFLNPYPRDFRKGWFKYVSAPGMTASRADLKHTLVEGVAGTSMPSFALLPDAEIEALIEYVRYLSLRGQMEETIRDFLADGEVLDRLFLDEEGIQIFIAQWKRAEKNAIQPPPRPSIPLAESIAKGKELYFKKEINCVSCHGPQALGDGKIEPHFDKWNEPKKDHPEWYALPRQPIPPRNLRLGVYRGGRRPVDVYRRISAGINASNMNSFNTLPPEDIWYLVDYVMSLPYDAEAAMPDTQMAGRSQR